MEGVSIRIDREVWHSLKVRAAQQNVTVGRLASELIEKELSQELQA